MVVPTLIKCPHCAKRDQENKKAIAAGLTVTPHKVAQETPTYSAIGVGFKRMGETEKTALKNSSTLHITLL